MQNKACNYICISFIIQLSFYCVPANFIATEVSFNTSLMLDHSNVFSLKVHVLATDEKYTIQGVSMRFYIRYTAILLGTVVQRFVIRRFLCHTVLLEYHVKKTKKPKLP